MAAQQGKFQWSSELGGSSTFGKGVLDDEEDPCVICHEEMTPETTKILDCGHRFHAEVSCLVDKNVEIDFHKTDRVTCYT